jgi:predicted DNA-binding transcriptional regulator AlpA
VTRALPFTETSLARAIAGLEKAGQFSKRIKIGPQRVGWSLSEISAWINAHKAQRDG